MRNNTILCKKKVTWDSYVISVTVVVTLLLFYAAYEIISAYKYDKDILLVFGLLVLITTILYAVLTLPLSVVITDNELIINQILKQKIIKINAITEVGVYKKSISDIGMFSTGGFCGIRGKYRNATIGIYDSYVCNSKQSILIQTKNKKNFVLSCEDHITVVALLTCKISEQLRRKTQDITRLF